MPGSPPLDLLMGVENDVRKSGCEKKISDILDQSCLDDYWLDWCKVLASHRATKLKDHQLANKLLLSTAFEGYRYFAKP